MQLATFWKDILSGRSKLRLTETQPSGKMFFLDWSKKRRNVAMTAIEKKLKNYDIHPFTARAVDSLSAQRRTTPQTIQEHIDNAIDAGAENIDITTEKDGKCLGSVIITDDGCGMDERALFDSFTLGAAIPRNYGRGSHGKYGIGGTHSSLARFEKKVTCTKTDTMDPIARKYDMEDVRSCGEWTTSTVDPLMYGKELSNKSSGTSIHLEKPKKREDYENLNVQIGASIANVYSSTLRSGKVSISLNGENVNAACPIGTDIPKTRFLFDDHIDIGDNKQVRLTIVDLQNIPKKSQKALNQMNDKASNDKVSNSLIANSGFYFLRNDRLISSAKLPRDPGDNSFPHGTDMLVRHPNLRFVRALVSFDSDLDTEFGVSNDKNSVEIAESVAGKLAAAAREHFSLCAKEQTNKANEKKSGTDDTVYSDVLDKANTSSVSPKLKRPTVPHQKSSLSPGKVLPLPKKREEGKKVNHEWITTMKVDKLGAGSDLWAHDVRDGEQTFTINSDHNFYSIFRNLDKDGKIAAGKLMTAIEASCMELERDDGGSEFVGNFKASLSKKLRGLA